ncbi:MAG: hypothetical protein K6F64_02735 [Clostridia bacterium]|nr:hypothetical protein [Clostridia bacterium]
MAFIRSKKEERTGYQSGSPYTPDCDCKCDFVMVYRLDDSSEERIKAFRENGYVIHFMTGISWGSYLDYLNGDFDGRLHWDEAQEDRYGNKIVHGENTPYMVPTISFSDYLSVKLRKIVDLGVEAIHVEEPEFWDRAGYSPAFKKEYEMYYREPWSAPHESVDAKYKCSRLKAYLFTRVIDRVCASLKNYAKIKYDKDLRFYVPTHSLLNYTQWKIVSPEGKLADLPYVDGCIAQVWTGTSREKNWYNGVYAERTFETAYLEYGVMQELVKGTGRKMWFLHDPIEDNPIFDWDDYEKNYFKIITASLLHPKVNSYEICPWPNRVFCGKYPKDSPDSMPIPDSYRTVLNNMFNTLGNIEADDSRKSNIGILMGDCQLYQREYPDSEFSEKPEEITGTVLVDSDDLISDIADMMKSERENRELLLKYQASNSFPGFYGLALPLLKNGIPVRPVLIDNARRYAGYLDDYDVLLMSYEYMKPEYPDVNAAISEWVMRGGILIYVGDGKDPFHRISSWWSGKYPTAADHLFDVLGIAPDGNDAVFNCGKGFVGVMNENPSKLLFSADGSKKIREFFKKTADIAGFRFEFKNSIVLENGGYIIAAAFDESTVDTAVEFNGLFADMFTPDFKIITNKTLNPGDNTLLVDLNKYKENIIGTSCRIESFEIGNDCAVIKAHGASGLNACMRIRLPFIPSYAQINGDKCGLEYESDGKTTLLMFRSENEPLTIEIHR